MFSLTEKFLDWTADNTISSSIRWCVSKKLHSKTEFLSTLKEKHTCTFFLQVWPAVLLCRRTPTYYGRIVVKILYTPAPIKKNCAVFKNVCIHQCVQRCVYMYIVRTRFYTNLYIVSKRKHNDQFSLKGLKKNVRFRFNKNCKNVHLKIGIQSRHTKTLFG
jgi:hypothetical protein